MTSRQAQLARWVAAAEAAETPIDPAQAAGWLELLEAAPDELEGLVALHARSEAEAGRPASRVVGPLLALAPLVEARAPVERLIRLSADAAAVGAATRVDRQHRRRARTHNPVLPVSADRILACAVGPLDGEVLDALLGRALGLAAARGASELWLDLSGVDDHDLDLDLLSATAGAYPEHELASEVRLVVSGLETPERLRATLTARGVAMDRVEVTGPYRP